VENWQKLIRGKNGFTLVELIIVIIIIAIIAAITIPGIARSIRRANFENKVKEVVTLLEKARTQALASELDDQQKVPLGGYGVFIDINSSNQKAILFIDDWNETEHNDVNMNYGNAEIASRVLPDGKFTNSKDTTISTITINELSVIKLKSLAGTKPDGTDWPTDPNNSVTVIFRPPYAETTIVGNDTTTTELQSFEAKFVLVTENSERTIKFNRVTTTPEIILN